MSEAIPEKMTERYEGAAGSAQRDSAAAAPVAEPPARILVVDDEPLARQMFADLLEAYGFQVVTVAGGEEAFRFLDEVDLVLLDAMLPGRDGWSICKQIKEERDQLFPVIMVTARTSPEDVVRTFDAGADDYVAKPFHVAELTARIKSRLRAHRAEREIQEKSKRLEELAQQNYQLYEQAKKDAEERAALLREIDHRVRNNLSVIMGLVGMERNRRPARPAQEALASLENRLRAFLLVYESLRRQNYSGIPLNEIAGKMAQRLRNSIDPHQRVALDVTGPPILLDERQGFAVALTLNELLTNSMRHAFPAGRDGRVEVHLSELNGDIRLEVRDDGVGYEADESADALGSGRSIVAALVQSELGGAVEHNSGEKGTSVVVSFPRALREPRIAR